MESSYPLLSLGRRRWYLAPVASQNALQSQARIQYIQNPPEGMTSDEVHDMSDEDLLDMDYFLQ